MNRIQALCLTLSILSGLAAVPVLVANPETATAACEMPRLPAGATVRVIGDELVANGLPLSIVEVQHAMSNAEMLSHFRALWTPGHGKPPRFVEYPLGVWTVLAHRSGPCFYTVQVRTEAMGLSTLAILGMGKPEAAALHGAPPPLDFPTAEVLSHLRSQDQGKAADTWVLSTTRSASGLAKDFNDLLSLQGWHLLVARGSDNDHSPLDSDSRVLIFQRGHEDLGIAIGPGPNGASAVVTRVIR